MGKFDCATMQSYGIECIVTFDIGCYSSVSVRTMVFELVSRKLTQQRTETLKVTSAKIRGTALVWKIIRLVSLDILIGKNEFAYFPLQALPINGTEQPEDRIEGTVVDLVIWSASRSFRIHCGIQKRWYCQGRLPRLRGKVGYLGTPQLCNNAKSSGGNDQFDMIRAVIIEAYSQDATVKNRSKQNTSEYLP